MAEDRSSFTQYMFEPRVEIEDHDDDDDDGGGRRGGDDDDLPSSL
jgi:hypothetical protein